MSNTKSTLKKADAPAPMPPEVAPTPQRQVEAYLVPAALMDVILRYLASRPWQEVEGIINQVKATVRPIFKNESNETESKSTSNP